MSMSPSENCELLPWDTEFFHCRIARVRGDTLGDEQASQIDQWSRDNRIQCLYFLARADDPGTLHNASRHGFGLVDIRVTLARAIGQAGNSVGSRTESAAAIRPVRPEDMPALQALACTLHTDTRFFCDHHFSRPLAASLYATWIKLECEGRAQRVFVATSPVDEPVGYISCQVDRASGLGQIGLVGVREEARGSGVGRGLVLKALDWFEDQGAKEIGVFTQGRNRAAQRLYQRCGFVTENLQLWYHKWYSDSNRG
jgi:ribosomal protein S18 acetylase RimI-like enzyme